MMFTSFKYEVRQADSGPQLVIFGSRRPRPFALIFGTLAITPLAYGIGASAWKSIYDASLVIAFSLVCGAVALVSYVGLAKTLNFSLTDSQLRVQSVLWGISLTRLIPLNRVLAFGFGNFGTQMAPVLRIEIDRGADQRTEWLVLAGGVTNDEVGVFLNEVKNRGFRLVDVIMDRSNPD
jgi:hypothetical protein